MKKNRAFRWTAALLTGALLLPQAAPLAQAAAPQPQTDEAVYVTLDAYGALDGMRIVKGVSLNGATQLSDFGSYSAVYNMTSYDEPQLREDGVDFNLPDLDSARFYYECIPSDPAALQLPWSFDVSYKLDGVPTEADALAGAQGLVEITIHAIPNPAADAYYRNNMALLIGTGIDMNETKSLEAPGAQVQSFGSYKIAVFLGLPGQENTYTLRIGSNDFQSMGIFMLMTPATLSQLDTISDLRNARDTLEGAHDDLYAGLTDVLDTMDGMQSGIQSMADGIAGINTVRQQLIQSRGEIDPDIDAALDQLTLLTGSSEALIPELETAQTDLNAFHENVTAVFDQLTVSRNHLSDYQSLLTDLKGNLSQLEDLLTDLDSLTEGDWLYLEQIRSALEDIRKDSNGLQGELSDLRSSLDSLDAVSITLTSLAQSIEDTLAALDPEGIFTSGLTSTLSSLQRLISLCSDVSVAVQNTLYATEDIFGSLNELVTASDATIEQLQALGEVLDDYQGTGADTAALGQQAVLLIQHALARLDVLLSLLTPIQQTLDQTNADINTWIPKVTDTATTLTDTLTAANTLFSDVRDTLRAVRDRSDASMQQSIDGLIDVMQRAADSGSTTGDLQTATDSIHNTISDEVDKVEEDSNLLNVDNSLALKSFTSAQNPAPASLQFILRTSEISVEDETAAPVEEAAADDTGVWDRIVHVFQTIFDAISSFFGA